MTPFLTLLIAYGLITLGSASVLYFSFKNRVDSSGRYFLLAEFLVLAQIFHLTLINIYPQFVHLFTLFAVNFTHLGAETAILLSIYALTKPVRSKAFIVAILLVGIYCAVIEYCRFSLDPKLPFLLFPIASFTLAISTWYIGKNASDNELRLNLFFRWFYFLQLGIAVLALIRIGFYGFGIYITPRNADLYSTLFFCVFVVFNVFRYISYQSLRISWVSPLGYMDNPLNQNLFKAVKEKNQFLDRLISSNRALGISALANSIAHQFSQPLTGIILQTESVKRDLTQAKSHPQSVEALNTVADQLGKLSLLITNLRRLFGGKERDFKSLSAQVLCNGILDIIEPTLASKQIKLTRHYQSNPMIFGNGTQIQQVLINVFNNAIDSIVSTNPTRREITLTITEGNGYGKLIIKDTGGGISPEILPVIFELYQSSKQDGLGIGLWLSKEIIEQHKGTISARNDPQSGAVLEICIPLAVGIKEVIKE